MSANVYFVTGTSTGVGKTVFAALLTRELSRQGLRVAGLKPVCSGGRQDAIRLRKAGTAELSLDEVNPWHFHAALAPVLAARKEHKRLLLHQVLTQIELTRKGFEILVVEGAGGLLSPMGEDFDSRELLVRLRATPLIVAANELGAVNQVRLVLSALPPRFRARAHIFLRNSRRPDAASQTNRALLAGYFQKDRIHHLPWLNLRQMTEPPASVRRLLRTIARM